MFWQGQFPTTLRQQLFQEPALKVCFRFAFQRITSGKRRVEELFQESALENASWQDWLFQDFSRFQSPKLRCQHAITCGAAVRFQVSTLEMWTGICLSGTISGKYCVFKRHFFSVVLKSGAQIGLAAKFKRFHQTSTENPAWKTWKCFFLRKCVAKNRFWKSWIRIEFSRVIFAQGLAGKLFSRAICGKNGAEKCFQELALEYVGRKRSSGVKAAKRKKQGVQIQNWLWKMGGGTGSKDAISEKKGNAPSKANSGQSGAEN